MPLFESEDFLCRAGSFYFSFFLGVDDIFETRLS
jgi:hypothetical protein